MSMKGVFLGITAFLFVCNLLASLFGYLPSPLDLGAIVATFVTVGLVIVVLSLIPVINSGASSISQFVFPIVIIGLLFSVSFPFGGYEIPVGLGWGSNMMGLFPTSLADANCVGFLFFGFLTVLAVIAGMMTAMGGD